LSIGVLAYNTNTFAVSKKIKINESQVFYENSGMKIKVV
jgi:hypothetical protein